MQPYYSIAQNYGFANYMFQTNQGPSFIAHQFILSGTSAPSGTVGGTDYDYFAAENPSNEKDTGCAGSSTSVWMINQNGQESGGNGPNAVAPCFTHNSLPTLLDENGLSWRYYAYKSGAKGIWTAPNGITEICWPLTDGPDSQCGGSDWVNDVVLDPHKVLSDMGYNSSPCNLANVSWVTPNGDSSDHPGFQGVENNSLSTEGGPA